MIEFVKKIYTCDFLANCEVKGLVKCLNTNVCLCSTGNQWPKLGLDGCCVLWRYTNMVAPYWAL